MAAAISAHRGGSEAAPRGTCDAYYHAVGTGAEAATRTRSGYLAWRLYPYASDLLPSPACSPV